MGNVNHKNSAGTGDKYKIAVIGDTSAGKTMLLLGLIMTSKKALTKRLTVASEDHQDEIAEMRKQLQKGNIPAGTTNLTTYNLNLQITGLFGGKASIYPLVFRDYKGGDIQNGISFFDQKFGDCDGVLFLMNPGQPVLNLGKAEDTDDATLSMLTNLINGISGGTGDRKCRAIAMAAAVTAMDRIRKGGDLYAHRNKFYDTFNRYIVNPLKTNASGIACKTDFKISVTGRVESQDKLKIIPNNNAAAPFLWLIDRIERQKHPFRYWTRRLWPVLLLVSLAAIGCLTWRWQHSDVNGINEEGDYAFKRAQSEFSGAAPDITSHNKHVQSLSNCVAELEKGGILFPDVKKRQDVVYTNLLSKYLMVEADAAFLNMKKRVESKQAPGAAQAYALRITNCQIDTPKVFDHYIARGRTKEVENAKNRLDDHRKKKVPEVVSEYNEKYFNARLDMLETNAVQEASEESICRLQRELDTWNEDCSRIEALSNIIADVSRRFEKNKPSWRAQYATNVVTQIWNPDLKSRVQEHPGEIFVFGRKKIGAQLQELLRKKEPQAQEALEKAKKKLLQDCRGIYFGQDQFSSEAGQYPQDGTLHDNLTSLLQGTTLTNCVAEWMSELHDKQRKWLRAEVERVKDKVQKAQDYSKFLMRPREGTGDRVHSLLVNCRKWADEEADGKKKTMFDAECAKVWGQFRARYFKEKKWVFRDDFECPMAEENLKDKIESFLENTRITNVRGEIGNWLSEMREMQKKWLIDAMEDYQKFRDGFDAFKEDGSGEDIKKVLVAAKSYINESLGETEDQQRVRAVERNRDELIEVMEKEYFKDRKFEPSHEFGLQDGARWSDVYQSAEEEMLEGLRQIFKIETGYDLRDVTNKWTRILWRHERDWLSESKSECMNEVGKFGGNANTIIDFVTQRSWNPFLWEYVRGIKTETKDLDLEQFKENLERHAKGVEIIGLKEQLITLHRNATVLSEGASKHSGKYAGLYDIFALRHLCTNGTPVRATSTRSSVNGNMDWKTKAHEMVQGGANAVSDESWLSSEYIIKYVNVTLLHPKSVIPFRHRYGFDNDQDEFHLTISKGVAGGHYFLGPGTFDVGKNCQADNPWKITMPFNRQVSMSLFSDIVITGGVWESYTRTSADGYRDKDPPSRGDEKHPISWEAVIRVPHLQSTNSSPSKTLTYASYAGIRFQKGSDTLSHQDAELTVSIDGEVVGSTPYDRIDACITKAKEMESDNSNDWLKWYRKAETRLEELNKNLSEGGELDAGGQP